LKVLVLEDDPEVAAEVSDCLSKGRHEVVVCADGHEAFLLAARGSYDVLVFDRLVPGLDGLSAVKALRAAGCLTPVMFLSAVGGVRDRVAGLEAGGDDYLIKPFARSELIARVNALGRRPPIGEVKPVLRAGDLEMDLFDRSVTRAGRRIELKPQEFRLLACLLQHAGEVVTRAMLLEKVWDIHFDPKTNIVETHMSRLRAKLAQHGGAELIHTVRGAGYVLRALPAEPT